MEYPNNYGLSQDIGITPEELESQRREINNWQPSDFEKQVINQNRSLFRISQIERDQPFENFDGLTLIQFIEDQYRRYNTNINVRDDIEDWQSVVHDKFTANKVDAILGKIVQVLPIAEVQGRGDEDLSRGLIMSNLYEYSEDMDDYDEFIIAFLQEAIIKGTAIGYEGQEMKVQQLRYVRGAGDKLTVFNGKRTTNRLFAQVVKLEEFYPSSVGVRRIKDMPRCFWRRVVSWQQFQYEFKDAYEKAKYVKPHKTNYSEGEARPYYQDFISHDIRDGQVEILYRYDKELDQFILEANCVWLNPLMMPDESEDVQPLPFNHKELPFFDIKYQQFSSDFFYGRGLPDKLKPMQDVLDVMTNMLLDQSFLTIFPPILTNGFDSIEDDYLRPGRRTPVDTGGLPINEAFMKIDLGTPGNWHQFILNYTRKIMEESSLDAVSSGTAGGGDRTTATEVQTAASGVMAMIGLFGKWIKYGVKRKAYLRTKNIAQFWMDANSPMVEEIMGEGSSADAKKAFNTVKIGSAIMTGGQRGTKIIEMYQNKNDMPTAAQQKLRANIYELSNNRKIEYVALDPEYIANMDFDIKLVPSTKTDMTKDIQKALWLEKIRVYLSFFPNMINLPELLAQTAEIMGDDPTKIIAPSVLNPQQQNPANNSMQMPGAQTTPQGNVAQNMVQGMMGGGGSNSMSQMASMMQG